MPDKWTREQMEAITDESRQLLVAAAAGAGKTAVLVERIIRKVTQGEMDIDRLLVVTFTNAAAAEMRERISQAIIKELNNPRGNQGHLRRQMALLTKANITTLHSFSLDIVRKYAHILDIDGSFRIGDQIECNLIEQEILDNLLEERYNTLDSPFEYLIDAFGGERSDDYIAGQVLKLYRFSRSQPDPDSWLYNLSMDYNNINKDQNNWLKVLTGAVKLSIEGILHNYCTAIELVSMDGGPYPYLDLLEQERRMFQNLYMMVNSDWDGLSQGIKGISFKRLPPCKGEGFDTDLKDLVGSLRDDIKNNFNKIAQDYFTQDLNGMWGDIAKLAPTVKVLSDMTIRFGELYNKEKKNRGILDFNDLEHYALELLSLDYICREIGMGYDEVLVDEYQDINGVQERIIQRVSELSRLFMVGDVKQSIYRFRLADPSLFQHKNSTFTESIGADQRKLFLSKNFRSRCNIINSINYVFSQLMTGDFGEIEYSKGHSLVYGADYYGGEEAPVELYLFDKSQELDEEDDRVWIEREGTFIGEKIKSLLNSCEKVLDKETGELRNVQYKDIVILLRTAKGKANTLSDLLLSMGIPCHGDLGSGYFEAIEVMVILSLLNIIDNPLQDIPMASVLRSPIVGITLEEMIHIRGNSDSLWDGIKEVTQREDNALNLRIKPFFENLERWRTIARREPLTDLLWDIYQRTGYYNFLGGTPGGQQRQGNLMSLIDRASQFEGTSYRGLFRFLRFIERLRENNEDLSPAKSSGEKDDVVRIMSIHKSKGLEFPIVFLPDLGKQFNIEDIKGKILFHKDLGVGIDYVDINLGISYPTISKLALKHKIKEETLAEELRILYVALTRAKERLILTGSVRDLSKAFLKWAVYTPLEKRQLPTNLLINANSSVDWIIPSILRHRDFKLNYGLFKVVTIDDPSRWHIQSMNIGAFPQNNQDSIVINTKDQIIKILEDQRDSSKDDCIIFKCLSWIYPQGQITKYPINISVTELNKKLQEGEIEYYPLANRESRGALTAAQRGILTHSALEHLPLDMVMTKENICSAIQGLKDREILNQIEEIEIDNIVKLFESDLGKRLLRNPKGVRREVPFVLELPIKEVYGEGVKGTETVYVQGIIDCIIIEDDGIVIIDFKNDMVNKANVEIAVKRHKDQIYLYKKALETITGMKVKECYLYLLKPSLAISI